MANASSKGAELSPPPYGGQQTSSIGAFRTAFASLSMHSSDCLRLNAFPAPIITLIRQAIVANWASGIQRERDYHGAYEFKLRGVPWYGHSSDAVTARRLMLRLLQALYDAGWVLNFNSDVSKKLGDLDCLFFRHQDPPPAPCEWMCISFSNKDQIRFIDLPPQYNELVSSYTRAIGTALQRVEPQRMKGLVELKIVGYPWYATDSQSATTARQLLLILLCTLEQHGWSVFASIDQKKTTNEHSGETDTWHCIRKVGWEHGAPVYHN